MKTQDFSSPSLPELESEATLTTRLCDAAKERGLALPAIILLQGLYPFATVIANLKIAFGFNGVLNSNIPLDQMSSDGDKLRVELKSLIERLSD